MNDYPLLDQFQENIQQEIESFYAGKTTDTLYEPLTHIIKSGGKHLRPMLVLMAYSLFKSDWNRILHASLLVELFHSFSLVYDDIMDNAPLRRGEISTHEKWGTNTALLSGCALFIRSYKTIDYLEDKHFRSVFRLFNDCVLDLCEGQQLDIEFEQKNQVSEEEYLEMIELKTASLIAFSLEYGAVLADASEETQRKIREFGLNIGLGFQITDDYLDLYAKKTKLGKRVGGDIIRNKKTYLVIKAQQKGSASQVSLLNDLLSTDFKKEKKKIKQVKAIFDEIGIDKICQNTIDNYYQKACKILDTIEMDAEKSEWLKSYTKGLIYRNF